MKNRSCLSSAFFHATPFLCVVASWLSFWIKLQIAPARVTLSIATFLTISQQQATINQGGASNLFSLH